VKRKKLLLGNWKMHKSVTHAVHDFDEMVSLLSQGDFSHVDVGIAAPSLYLSELAKKTKNKLFVFAQNAHWEREGAFTGEVSAWMLRRISVTGSLVAHSERRQYFGETNESSGKRMGGVIREGLKAVLCVGETLQERESGRWREVLASQLKEAFYASGLKSSAEFIGSSCHFPSFILAYEPVWAIGTGKAASAQEAQEAHAFLRKELENFMSHNDAEKVRILYGGSVKPQNAADFFKQNDVDGALVGGASLKPSDFIALCQLAK
jgi:triosephosphate isomerase